MARTKDVYVLERIDDGPRDVEIYGARPRVISEIERRLSNGATFVIIGTTQPLTYSETQDALGERKILEVLDLQGEKWATVYHRPVF